MNDASTHKAGEALVAATPGDSGAEPQAWEQIEEGRYQPRRIRGSCVGRELG
jgi:hypothetical protein